MQHTAPQRLSPAILPTLQMRHGLSAAATLTGCDRRRRCEPVMWSHLTQDPHVVADSGWTQFIRQRGRGGPDQTAVRKVTSHENVNSTHSRRTDLPEPQQGDRL